MSNSKRKRAKLEDAAPDTARVYERAKPEKESGMGRLEEDEPDTPRRPDEAHRAVSNAHPARDRD